MNMTIFFFFFNLFIVILSNTWKHETTNIEMPLALKQSLVAIHCKRDIKQTHTHIQFSNIRKKKKKKILTDQMVLRIRVISPLKNIG